MSLFKAAVVATLLSKSWALGIPETAPYLSRPDLIPSELNVTQNDQDSVNDAYIFMSPWVAGEIPGSAPYLGPHVYDKQGNLVWTGYGLPSILSNFMPIEGSQSNETQVSYFDGVTGQYGMGFGSYKIMDSSYRIQKNLGLKAPFLHDFHEFQYLSNDTAAFSTYLTAPYDLSAYNSSLQNGWIFDNVLIEIDATTDEINFQWNSIEHIPISETVILDQLVDGKGSSNEAPFDYLHMNSITKDDDGNYLISARHTWSLYYINGRTGELIWTINSNPNGTTNWDVDDDATFAFQHHARWVDPSYIGEEDDDNVRYISVFDNESNGSTPPGFRQSSRGLILKLTTTNNYTFQTVGGSNTVIGKVELFQEYASGDAVTDISTSQGSVQVLSDGNVFVGWGSFAAVSEYKLDGTKVFEAVPNDGTYGSYRAFKGNWSAVPFESPSIVAQGFQSNGSTVMYFSWNGATEASYYNISGGNSSSSLSHIAKVDRKGFEDGYTANGIYKYVKIEPCSDDDEKLSEYTTSAMIMDKTYYEDSSASETQLLAEASSAMAAATSSSSSGAFPITSPSTLGATLTSLLMMVL